MNNQQRKNTSNSLSKTDIDEYVRAHHDWVKARTKVKQYMDKFESFAANNPQTKQLNGLHFALEIVHDDKGKFGVRQKRKN